MKSRFLVHSLVGTILLLAPYMASAEQVMEEVIVTAQKREQNLQDTPISVTAFTGDALQKLGLRQSVDVTAQTPNFSVGFPNGETGIPALFIRGVGLSDFRVFTPAAIAPYADEVYIAQNAGQIFQLMDMERVEVLRGPQGTLYGRNATGGAVNYISRKPTDTLEADVRLTGAQYGYTQFEGAVGGPVTDDLGFRLALLSSQSDGWLKNRATGNDQQGIDELAWRALMQWDATDAVDLLFNVHGGRTRSDSVQYRHLGVWDATGTMCALDAIRAGQCADILGYSENAPYGSLPAVPAFDEGNYDFEAKNDTDFWGASIKATVDVGDMMVTSITAYDDLDDLRPEETDASPNDLLTGVLGVKQKTFSQDLRLSGERDDWNWLAGVYYLNDDARDRSGFDILGALRPTLIGVDDPLVCADANGVTPPAGNPTGFCPGQFVYTSGSRTDQEITSWSVYGDASVVYSDKLTLNFGLRYTDETVKHDVLEIYDEPAAGNPVRLAAKNEVSFNRVSGRFVVNWQATPEVMYYGGVSSGFKAGGIDSTADGTVPYRSENLISYEGGVKSMLANGALRLNASLFYYDYKDLQVFTFVVVGAQTFSVLSNASDASIKGGELELQWLPTETTFVNFGFGYLDTKYDNFVDNITGDDFSGNEIIMSPKVTLNGLVQQDYRLGNGSRMTFQVDFNYQDDVFFDAQNNPLLSQEAYWLYNARVSWTSTGENWEVAAWGRNLGDKEYIVYAFDLSFFGFNEEMLGTPRSFGAEVSYHF